MPHAGRVVRGAGRGVAAALVAAHLPAPVGGRARWLHWDCNGETTAYLDGEPWAGLDVAHTVIKMSERACTLSPAEATLVLGGQGQLWAEGIPDGAVLDRQAWPRLCALAEALWSPRAQRDWNDFATRKLIAESLQTRRRAVARRSKWNPRSSCWPRGQPSNTSTGGNSLPGANGLQSTVVARR